MEKVTLPGLPDRRAADYQLDGFNPPRYARVVYVPQESKPDRKQIEAQAFEVDSEGRLVPAANGSPSRTPGTIHLIAASGIGDTHTLQPGWVRVVGDYSPTPAEGQDSLPQGAVEALSLPLTGTEGEMVYVSPVLYRWDAGMLESIMRAKASELAGLLRNAAALVDFDL